MKAWAETTVSWYNPCSVPVYQLLYTNVLLSRALSLSLSIPPSLPLALALSQEEESAGSLSSLHQLLYKRSLDRVFVSNFLSFHLSLKRVF